MEIGVIAANSQRRHHRQRTDRVEPEWDDLIEIDAQQKMHGNLSKMNLK